jgi:alkyl hydroperoxide reductase subunit AhpC
MRRFVAPSPVPGAPGGAPVEGAPALAVHAVARGAQGRSLDQGGRTDGRPDREEAACRPAGGGACGRRAAAGTAGSAIGRGPLTSDGTSNRARRLHIVPEEILMALRIGDEAPNFKAQTTQGPIDFHQWIGNEWAILFSHPKDFTPVCTTELGYMARIKPEFDRRGTKIIGLSVDSVEDHSRWANDIQETQGSAPNYPIIGDADFKVSKLYDMLPATVSGDAKARTPAENQTVRTVFLIGPDKKVKLILMYPMTTGRNFDEVLRVLDSLQLTSKYRVATPANWKQGEDVIISGSVTDDEARKAFPEGWRAPKPYIRIVHQPGTHG